MLISLEKQSKLLSELRNTVNTWSWMKEHWDGNHMNRFDHFTERDIEILIGMCGEYLVHGAAGSRTAQRVAATAWVGPWWRSGGVNEQRHSTRHAAHLSTHVIWPTADTIATLKRRLTRLIYRNLGTGWVTTGGYLSERQQTKDDWDLRVNEDVET